MIPNVDDLNFDVKIVKNRDNYFFYSNKEESYLIGFALKEEKGTYVVSAYFNIDSIQSKHFLVVPYINNKKEALMYWKQTMQEVLNKLFK